MYVFLKFSCLFLSVKLVHSCPYLLCVLVKEIIRMKECIRFKNKKSSGGDGECHHISHNSASGFINGNYCRGRGCGKYTMTCVCVGCTCHGTGTSIQQCFISSGCIIYKKHLLLLDPQTIVSHPTISII